jgi:hypothetical protein
MTRVAYSAVVPANAGTHTPRQSIQAPLAADPCNNTGLWLWVPARASLGRDDEDKN